MPVSRRRKLASFSLALAALAAAAPAGAAAPCRPGSPLTLLGLDTAAGSALFSTTDGTEGWLLELDLPGATARLRPDPGPARAGASIGPGPPLAARPCGRDCLQPLVWRAGRWSDLGEPLTAPAGVTVHGTWDRGGAAWLVLHAPGGAPGTARALAFRRATSEWENRGALTVGAIAGAGAQPVPDRRDAVASGTGLFAAAEPAGDWLRGLPDVPQAWRGAVHPLGGTDALYVAPGGAVYTTHDQGRGWLRPRWTPWSSRTVEAWRPGADYLIEAPAAAPRSPLPLVWVDRRAGDPATLHLTTARRDGAWSALARLPDRLATGGAESEIGHYLVADDGRWALVGGCVATRRGPALLVRTMVNGRLSDTRALPLELAPRGD